MVDDRLARSLALLGVLCRFLESTLGNTEGTGGNNGAAEVKDAHGDWPLGGVFCVDSLLKPSPGAPTMFSGLTTTSSNVIMRVSAQRWPVVSACSV